MMKKPGSFARSLLASIGGLAAMVAGANEHWFRDGYTEPKNRTRGRTGKGTYGRSLTKHFDAVGVNWSAKKNKVAASYGKNTRYNKLQDRLAA